MTNKDPEKLSTPNLSKGAKELREEVLDRGQCTSCGMCLDLCPYLEEMGEHVASISDCRGTQGRCYAVCPRAETNLDELRRAVFPDLDMDYALGPHQSVWLARASDKAVRQRGQYGGSVTAIALSALESGRIDAALLTKLSSDPDEPCLPKPFIATTRDQIISAAGSKYTACPSLKILDKAVREDAQRLGVVGRPCQVLALRKRMRIPDPDFPGARIALIVGLFCMWSFSYREFRQWMIPLLGARRPVKFDIPKGGFLVETDQGRLDLSHEDLQSRTRHACQQCYDFTGELADLSVGSTEWKDDWNTLIVRTETGQKAIETATEKQHLELKPFPEERMLLLRQAAYNKKKRVLEALEEESRQGEGEPYLKISQMEKQFFTDQDPQG